MRICSECKEVMIEGYVIDRGRKCYCSTKCLQRHCSKTEYEALCANNLELYWTTWNVSEYLNSSEIDLIEAIKRTLKNHRPEVLPKHNFCTLLAWITLYFETL